MEKNKINWEDNNVLLVDGSLSNRLYLKSALKLNGANVFTVSKGSDAVRFLKSNINIDLVLVNFKTIQCSCLGLLKQFQFIRRGIDASLFYTYLGNDKKLYCEISDGLLISPIALPDKEISSVNDMFNSNEMINNSNLSFI